MAILLSLPNFLTSSVFIFFPLRLWIISSTPGTRLVLLFRQRSSNFTPGLYILDTHQFAVSQKSNQNYVQSAMILNRFVFASLLKTLLKYP